MSTVLPPPPRGDDDERPLSTGQKLAVWYAFLGVLLLGAIVHWIISGRFRAVWLIPLLLFIVAFTIWTVREFGGRKRKSKAKPRRRSGRGQKPMIWIVGLVLVVFALANEATGVGRSGPLWRVFASIAVFLYLWWLSSLLFDLAFVWHRYIRGDAARRFLRENVQRKNFSPKNDPPPTPQL